MNAIICERKPIRGPIPWSVFLAKMIKTAMTTFTYSKDMEGALPQLSHYRAMIQQSLFSIETHLHENIGLEEVASKALLSPYHYHRVFRNEVGMTVVHYIRNRRMSLASTTLRSTDAGILDIALAVVKASGLSTEEIKKLLPEQ